MVKMPITLEQDGKFGSNVVYLMYFNIVQPLVYRKVTRLHRTSFWLVELFW